MAKKRKITTWTVLWFVLKVVWWPFRVTYVVIKEVMIFVLIIVFGMTQL